MQKPKQQDNRRVRTSELMVDNSGNEVLSDFLVGLRDSTTSEFQRVQVHLSDNQAQLPDEADNTGSVALIDMVKSMPLDPRSATTSPTVSNASARSVYRPSSHGADRGASSNNRVRSPLARATYAALYAITGFVAYPFQKLLQIKAIAGIAEHATRAIESALLFVLAQCYYTGVFVYSLICFCSGIVSSTRRSARNFIHYRKWKKMVSTAATSADSEDSVRVALMPAPSFDVVRAYARVERSLLAMGISVLTGIPRAMVELKSDRGTRNRYMQAFARRCATVFIPAAAILLLCAVLYSIKDYSIAVKVYIDGKELAVLSDETVYSSVANRVEKYVSNITGDRYSLKSVPVFQTALVHNDSIGATEVLEDTLLRSATDAIAESNGLFVDGDLIATNDDLGALEDLLFALRSSYITGEGATVEFAQDVRIEPGMYARNKSMSIFDIQSVLTSTVEEEVLYSIQKDDLMGTIAPKFDMTVAQLKALNPTVDERRLREGMQLTVSRATPYLTMKALKTVQYNEPIPYTREVISDDSMYTYETKVRTAGKEGVVEVTAEVFEVDGIEVSRLELNRDVLSSPVTQIEIRGTKTPPKTAPTGTFRAPVSGGTVTSRFGGRGGSQHTGIDIALPVGTTIVAADGGTVTFAGYSGGYGYIVKMSHGKGVETWYAHCSALLVSRGTEVAKGQPIARVGSTGRSTGSHLHFEVRINGVAVNPAPYIGR